jgi:hypothetical protein
MTAELSTTDQMLGIDPDAVDRLLLIALQRWESDGGAVLPRMVGQHE